MIDFKDEYISSLQSARWSAWCFVTVSSLAGIALILFRNKEIWSTEEVIWTIFFLIVLNVSIYFVQIKECNKKIKEASEQI